MRLWTCTDHDTHWPVGGASIVIAETEDQAKELLAEALSASGLKPGFGFNLVEVELSTAKAIVLMDGNY